jgi:uncharacterized protein
MIYRSLGNTGLTVSALGFGAMRLPIQNFNPDFDLAVELIQYAIEKGINFFDIGTFYCYGHCEQVFGLSIKDVKDDKLLICGKNSSHQSGSLDWKGQLANSLRLFNRQFFNIYFIHYLNLEQWKSFFEGNNITEQIWRCREKGLFQHLGFSSHDSPENVKKLIDSGWFEAVILSYNILNREYEPVMKYAYEKGLGVIVMNPLAGGQLANVDFIFEKIKSISSNKLELFMNYVLSQPFIHTVLSGMESKEMVDENVRTVHKSRLNLDEIEYLDTLIHREKAKSITLCTACNYCMPCTQGIDIPSVISIWNKHSILMGDKVYDRDYTMLPVNAESCIQCDLCSEKCPQHLKIPQLMEMIAENLINS